MLRYRQLTLSAGALPVLDRIDLEIEGPGVFSLLGPSGVGKSSLLRATQRLIEPGRGGWSRSGDVLFHGESVFRRGLSQRDLARRIGFVPQRPRMLAGSVLDNVEFALRHTTRLSRAQIRERAESALGQVGLDDEVEELSMPAWKLSGGQGQRLAVARAIALDPEVLLLDEPISSLDPLAADRVEQVIRRIARRRLVVMVTHKVGSAMRLARSAAFMLRGPRGARVLEVGDVPEILESPRDPVARELVRMSYGLPAGSQESTRATQSAPAAPPALAARKILFVCGGNTSRSPMAAAFCRRQMLDRLGHSPAQLEEMGYHVESAGLEVWPGAGLDASAAAALRSRGVEPPDHRVREVSVELVATADRVYAMTEEQCRELRRRFPSLAEKVERLDPVADTADPHYLDPQGVEWVAARLLDAVRYRLAEWRTA